MMAAASNRLVRCAALVVAGLLLAGCATNDLVSDLNERGVTRATTASIVFVGGAGAFASDTKAVVTDPAVKAEVWTIIEKSYPSAGQFVLPSTRIDRIAFYTSQDAALPAAVVFVDASDACYVSDSTRRHYDPRTETSTGVSRCAGIGAVVDRYFRSLGAAPAR
jgi:hypothetical protein